MTSAVLPADEAHRLAALRDLGLLDTPREERFDRITRLLARVLAVPISIVNFVDGDRQWGKSCVGVPSSEAPRTSSFCAHAILGEAPLVVPDTMRDRRFVANPLVTGDPYLRAYAGQPVHGPTGHRIGTLCVADTVPRDWAAGDLQTLFALASWVELEIASADLSDATNRVRRSEERLRAVLDGAAEGIVALDEDGAATLVNAAAGELAGRPAAALLGGLAFASLAAGGACAAREHAIDRADGEPVPVELSCARLEDGGAVLVFRDIRERQAVQRLKDQFVASVSHELRTPLTVIHGYVGAMLDEEPGPLTPSQREDLGIVQRNVERLRALIEDLLFVSAANEGGLRFASAPVDLAAVVAETVDTVRPAAQERDVAVRVDLGTLPPVTGDAARLGQAFANLVGNAVKFSPPGGDVRVRAGADGDAVVVEVADRGPGIPAEEIASLGTRFFRASTAGAVPGTGLGLAITREIVERHGGALEIESAPGAGSTFRVRLPVA